MSASFRLSTSDATVRRREVRTLSGGDGRSGRLEGDSECWVWGYFSVPPGSWEVLRFCFGVGFVVCEWGALGWLVGWFCLEGRVGRVGGWEGWDGMGWDGEKMGAQSLFGFLSLMVVVVFVAFDAIE